VNLPQGWLMGSARFLILILILISSPGSGVKAIQQKPTPYIEDIDAGTALTEIASLPKQINEASGLEITSGKHLWTHNDGGLPVLYCLDTTGQLVRTLQLNHPNSGWEDLAQDKNGTLYVGAFGNNKNDKQTLKIYMLPKPDSIRDIVFTAQTITFSYKDQKDFPPAPSKRNFDMDAFIAMNDSLYLFSKNRTTPFTGYSKIYTLPQQPGSYIAVCNDSIYLGKGPMIDNWVTAADISPDGKILVLLSHQYLWLIKNFKENRFSTGKIFRVKLNHFSHKAGVSFLTNTKLCIVDELEMGLIGGKLYTLNLEQVLKNLQ
jgi:hypothetical protein